MNRILHWIDGQAVEGTSGRSGPVFDPATGQQQSAVDFASVGDVDRAVAVAKAAFTGWRSTKTHAGTTASMGNGKGFM